MIKKNLIDQQYRKTGWRAYTKFRHVLNRLMQPFLVGIVLFTSILTTGCVERLITVTTKPQGAIVWLNDREVGASPVTVPFTWYGQYDVVVRKDGYQTVKTSRKTPVPIYQYPVIDLFTECLLPVKLVDKHQWHLDLTPNQSINHQELIERATSTRNQADTEK